MPYKLLCVLLDVSICFLVMIGATILFLGHSYPGLRYPELIIQLQLFVSKTTHAILAN